MNKPKVTDKDYIQFLIAAQKLYSCTEAERCAPDDIAHDAFTRFLHRQPPDTEALWKEVLPLVSLSSGVLVLDDSTLDKPYSEKIELVTRHYSGKHHGVVEGINVETLLWRDGDAKIPLDFRISAKTNDGKTKNDHFVDMLQIAYERGFQPECVLFDSWYASLSNLKAIRAKKWRWLTQLKSNRCFNPSGKGKVHLSELNIPEDGRRVHLRGYGLIKVFKVTRSVSKNGNEVKTEYWATNDLEMDEGTRLKYAEQRWVIEEYHRTVKQGCGIEKSQVRKARAQRNHIGYAIRAFVRFECYRLRTGIGAVQAKLSLVREALRTYLAKPCFQITELPPIYSSA
jgi:hypothetical protein